MKHFGAWGLGLWMLCGGVTLRTATAQQAQNAEEYGLATAAQTEIDSGKKLERLDAWRTAYPESELFAARDAMYLQTYVERKMAREAFDMSQQILSYKPRDLTALADALQTVTAIKPSPAAADLDTGELDALAVLDDPAVFAARPGNMSDAQWEQTEMAVKTFAKGVLLAIYTKRDATDAKRAVSDLQRLVDRDPEIPGAAAGLEAAKLRLIGEGN